MPGNTGMDKTGPLSWKGIWFWEGGNLTRLNGPVCCFQIKKKTKKTKKTCDLNFQMSAEAQRGQVIQQVNIRERTGTQLGEMLRQRQ